MHTPKELALLQGMDVGELRKKHAQVFGEETRAHHKAFLVKRIAWRIQSLAEGSLSERARRRAAELANDADIRLHAPRAGAPAALGPPERTRAGNLHIPADQRLPMPGTVLTRDYKGRRLVVTILPRGFEHEGTLYKSLSAVARAVTGTPWNGYHFFRLLKEGSQRG